MAMRIRRSRIAAAALILVALMGFRPPAGTCAELLRNGDFAAGAEGWKLAAVHGARAEFAVDPTPKLGDGECAKVTVSRPTFTAWQIALRSQVKMEGGKRYRFSFDTVADGPGAFDVCVQAAEPPYRILRLAEVPVSDSPRTYSFLTPHVPQDGAMRVGFWFGNNPRRTFWLDNVSVEELSPEEMDQLERVPEGFENGDFSAGLTGWELRVHQGAVADLTVDAEPKFADGNCGKVVVTNATDTGWHIQLMQIFTVKEGRTYLATFSAVSDAAGPIVVGFQVPPPDNEVLNTEKVEVTATPTTYAVTSARTSRDSDMKLTFHLSGAGPRTFWMDKVSLTELPETDSQEEGGEPRGKD